MNLGWQLPLSIVAQCCCCGKAPSSQSDRRAVRGLRGRDRGLDSQMHVHGWTCTGGAAGAAHPRHARARARLRLCSCLPVGHGRSLEPCARAWSRPASRASTADRYKQVLPVPYACASTATSSDGVSWCILEAWEGRAAAVLENLIAVRISTASKHRWQPSARARPRLSWQSKII